jgi:ATP-binding cassette subfamily F protein 3
LLALSDVQIGYDEKVILREVALTIRPRERLGLLGRNGAGKSTLIKLLAAELKQISGKRVEGKDLNIGYFAQHQLEQLRAEESPLQHMVRLDPIAREQELLNYLGGFDFRGDMARNACANFSGGEKSRLALALLIWTRPNLLLLDEPTNHLDLEMRHALTLALQEYEGGVVIVSHDRALLRATCDQFILVAAGKAQNFDGDLDDYATWLARQRLEEQTPEHNTNTPSGKVNSYTQSKIERQSRIAQRRPLLKETEKLEQQIHEWQLQKTACDSRLNEPKLYENADKSELQNLLVQQAGLAQNIEQAEERWLAIHEQLESLPEIN